jgi:type II secretory pathway pseudopilin PulG
MHTTRRTAFTLFQLLVILALLGILLGLLLPAIAKVRQAAARTQSMNNLKQLALALHNYHDTYNLMPPGVDPNHFSTSTYLLPYVEQDNVFKSIDLKKPIDDRANAVARATTIPLFLSPLDPIPMVKKELAATNYIWSAGSKPALADNNGMLYLGSKIKLSDILDGLNNTVMAGETLKGDGGDKALNVLRQHVQLKADALKDLKDDSGATEFKDGKNIAGDRCASWMDGRFLQGTFTGTRKINDPRPDVTCGGQGGLSGLRSLMGGTSVAFGDGSVRFIQDTVTAETWKLLTDRNDGKPLPPGF